MEYAIKKPKGFLWSTNHVLAGIQDRLARGSITEEWLICPQGEASRAVTVAEFMADPSLLDTRAKEATSAKSEPLDAVGEASVVPFERRHDLDALRATAMLLGIGLHAALSYITVRFWPVYDDRHHAFFDVFNSAIHGFRMPLFFMISGFFTAMLWRQRGLSALIKHRAKRILLPLVIFVVPVQLSLFGVLAFAMMSNSSQSGSKQPSENLWSAAKHNDTAALGRYLMTRELIDRPDPQTRLPALNLAALNGSTEAAQMLIEAGANVNIRTDDGSTPLGHAAFTGSADIVALLIENGAEINAINSYQATPLDSLKADWGVVQWVAGMLSLELDRQKVDEGRKVAAKLLREHGGKRKSELEEAAPVAAKQPDGEGQIGLLAGVTSAYQSFVQWPGFQKPQIFGHLWFLWFLCILILPFGLFALIADALRWAGPPKRLFLSPLLLLWVVPLTMIPQWFHGLVMPSFGPDTSSSFFPPPHIVILYAVFFYFGAVYFDCDDSEGRASRFWWVMLPVALLVVYPLGATLIFETESVAQWMPRRFIRPLAVFTQALYPWLMTFGLIGLFRKICSREHKTVRYISDSSYWLYIAHLPLIFLAQHLVKPLNLSPFAKFAIVCVSVTAVLLISYDLIIRYTFIGTLLNGKRIRPAKRTRLSRGVDNLST